LIFNALILQLR